MDYEAGVLSATCQTIQGESQSSSINLNSYISNQEKTLVWSREGNFASTSSNCRIESATPYGSSTQTPQSHLSCDVRTENGQVANAILTLDEHIENVNEQLQLY